MGLRKANAAPLGGILGQPGRIGYDRPVTPWEGFHRISLHDSLLSGLYVILREAQIVSGLIKEHWDISAPCERLERAPVCDCQSPCPISERLGLERVSHGEVAPHLTLLLFHLYALFPRAQPPRSSCTPWWMHSKSGSICGSSRQEKAMRRSRPPLAMSPAPWWSSKCRRSASASTPCSSMHMK